MQIHIKGTMEVNVAPKSNSAYDNALLFIFSSFFHRKEYVRDIKELTVMKNTFFALLLNYIKENEVIDDNIFDLLENKFGHDDIEILRNYNFDAIVNPEKYYSDCIRFVKREELNEEYEMLRERISTITDTKLRAEAIERQGKIWEEMLMLKEE